tara:strand:- start:32 stop:268 length:237 start_codon:yes stop_codon:yes gene_type:complete
MEEKFETIKPNSKEFLDLWPELSATRIKETIIDLADSLESKEELWEAWKTLNKAMSYLSAKHTIAETREEYIGGTNKD